MDNFLVKTLQERFLVERKSIMVTWWSEGWRGEARSRWSIEGRQMINGKVTGEVRSNPDVRNKIHTWSQLTVSCSSSRPADGVKWRQVFQHSTCKLQVANYEHYWVQSTILIVASFNVQSPTAVHRGEGTIQSPSSNQIFSCASTWQVACYSAFDNHMPDPHSGSMIKFTLYGRWHRSCDRNSVKRRESIV